jgi:hypothetical protein
MLKIIENIINEIMRKITKYIKPIIFLLLGIFLYFGLKKLPDTEFNRLTPYVLSLTLIAVIWYAWETMRLVQETSRQTEFSMTPFVTISYSEIGNKYKLMNLGYGVALHVKIDDIVLFKEKNLKFDYVHQEIDVLPPTGECEIRFKDADTLFDLGALLPRSAQRTFHISIRYRDIKNGKHVTKGKLGIGAFEFDKIAKIKWNSEPN